MQYVFFTVNDFVKEGGGSIRMYGILNALAKRGHQITFISNACDFSKFDSNIQHVYLDYRFSKKDKRIFQALLAIFPNFLLKIIYQKFFRQVEKLKPYYKNVNQVFFFEYLDNSIGYFLKENNLLPSYINDLHGVATLEFKFQYIKSTSFYDKVKFYFKHLLSEKLDKKVFGNATSLIFASEAMKKHFEEKYSSISTKDNYILPYLLSSSTINKPIKADLKSKLINQFSISNDECILLFAGGFKLTGGVDDLIQAFQKFARENERSRLFLIGDGPKYEDCVKIAQKEASDRIIFLGRTKYDDLPTYQDIADIIVCPDKQNVYSELIIHVKYLDALVSNKIVINGNFKSVLEVNKDESLSIGFKPSDIDSLASAISNSIANLEILKNKYMFNADYVRKYLTYKSQIEILERNIND